MKLGYLNALTILTNILSSQQHVALRFKFPHKLAIVTFMVVSASQEDGGGSAERRGDGSPWKPGVAFPGQA